MFWLRWTAGQQFGFVARSNRVFYAPTGAALCQPRATPWDSMSETFRLPSAIPSGFGGSCWFCHRELRGHRGLDSWRIFSAASVASGIPKGLQKVAGGRRAAAPSGTREPQRAMLPQGSQMNVRPPPGAAIDYVNVSGGIRCAQTTGYRLRSRRDSVARSFSK
ncbi:hypothetical protein EC9_00650 [Rosistilla ulvae]|uniref:Uncharacterized protein n=1 Tax=Rosistilla ulvae TaxID=1930277 RepID=A0A517LTG0_9BACT|nr:hypothetical protein EC9_00650 [Rosistilla ulvae]